MLFQPIPTLVYIQLQYLFIRLDKENEDIIDSMRGNDLFEFVEECVRFSISVKPHIYYSAPPSPVTATLRGCVGGSGIDLGEFFTFPSLVNEEDITPAMDSIGVKIYEELFKSSGSSLKGIYSNTIFGPLIKRNSILRNESTIKKAILDDVMSKVEDSLMDHKKSTSSWVKKYSITTDPQEIINDSMSGRDFYGLDLFYGSTKIIDVPEDELKKLIAEKIKIVYS